jgi:hypothetical protein
VRPQGLSWGALPITGDPPHPTLQGLHPWGPTLQAVGGWAGLTGSWQQPVPGNSGLNKDGWNLKNNQKELSAW